MNEILVSLGRDLESDMDDDISLYSESMFEVKGEYERFSHTFSWVFIC